MGVNIQFSQSFYWLHSWVLANIIQLGTQEFCDRFIDYRMDPGRRLYDQMVMAARCGVANIAEGSARHSTSIETEMRLLDVARASFDELQGDIFNFLLRRRAEVWPLGNTEREELWQTQLDAPEYDHCHLSEAAKHILSQKSKYDRWLGAENPEVVANALLVLCYRINRMLQARMERQHEQFQEVGGFTENMTADRLEARKRQAVAEGAPACPVCGKPMIRKMVKRGQRQGSEFWGCIDFPNCKGTRRI